jgi:hypothetical protein
MRHSSFFFGRGSKRGFKRGKEAKIVRSGEDGKW